jgi:hypothetical protein
MTTTDNVKRAEALANVMARAAQAAAREHGQDIPFKSLRAALFAACLPTVEKRNKG